MPVVPAEALKYENRATSNIWVHLGCVAFVSAPPSPAHQLPPFCCWEISYFRYFIILLITSPRTSNVSLRLILGAKDKTNIFLPQNLLFYVSHVDKSSSTDLQSAIYGFAGNISGVSINNGGCFCCAGLTYYKHILFGWQYLHVAGIEVSYFLKPINTRLPPLHQAPHKISSSHNKHEIKYMEQLFEYLNKFKGHIEIWLNLWDGMTFLNRINMNE